MWYFQATLFRGFPELASAIHRAMLSQQESPRSHSEADTADSRGQSQPTGSPGTDISETTFVQFASDISGRHLFQEYFDFYFSLFSSVHSSIDDKGGHFLGIC